jgi:hypothetical protein
MVERDPSLPGKKVQGLVPWEAPALERLLEMPLDDPVLELQLGHFSAGRCDVRQDVNGSSNADGATARSSFLRPFDRAAGIVLLTPPSWSRGPNARQR